MIWKVFLLCVEDGFNQESEVRDRREISRESEFSHIICLCAGTHGKNKVTDMDILGDRPCGSHTDQCLYAVSLDEFVGVDSNGRASHSCSHDRDRFITVKTGVTKHISCSVELLCTRKEISQR